MSLSSTSASYHTANFTQEATPSEIGQRIDRSLTKYPMKPSKHMVQRLIRIGTIRVNNKKTDPSYRIQKKDQIIVPHYFLNVETKQPPTHQIHQRIKLGKQILKTLIYEDDQFLILNKPSGLPVHGGSKQSLGIILALRSVRPELNELNLVHRLDKPTSGVLLLCKNLCALRNLHNQFQSNCVQKTYLAIVRSKTDHLQKQWIVNKAIPIKNLTKDLHAASLKGYDNTKAETHFSVEKAFDGHLFLVKVCPKQGKTHQIRIHSSYYETPILGDKKYLKLMSNPCFDNSNQFIDECLSFLPEGAIYLHASQIKCTHPVTQKPFTIDAELPKHWRCALQFLQKDRQ